MHNMEWNVTNINKRIFAKMFNDVVFSVLEMKFMVCESVIFLNITFKCGTKIS